MNPPEPDPVQSDRWDRVGTLFEDALRQTPEKRISYLKTACAGDQDLFQEVVSLLQVDEEAGSFFDQLSKRVGMVVAARIDKNELEQYQRVGPFRLISSLGRGGMGMVFLARRIGEKSGALYALKLLRQDLEEADFYARFLSERQILASLTHPNIARLVSGGVHLDGQPYYVMEYVDGERIDRYCQRYRLSLRDRLILFLQIARAVQYAHEQSIVHRDLKPSNVLVESNGLVKLLDFGIAKLLTGPKSQVKTLTGMRLMTLDYAAPEQILGGPISPAIDIYQLGVLLYELITGVSPYQPQSKSLLDLEKAVLELDAVRPSLMLKRGNTGFRIDNSEFGHTTFSDVERVDWKWVRALDPIVTKAMKKNPFRRYSTVTELIAEVDHHLSKVGGGGSGRTLDRLISPFSSRKRR